MRTQKAEVRNSVCDSLLAQADEPLRERGFERRRGSLVYTRRLEGGNQKVHVAIEQYPSDEPDAAAAIYPWYILCLPDVNDVARAMVDDQTELGGDFAITFAGPIEWTAPTGVGARWYLYQPESVPGVIATVRDFVLAWTVPFLDRYRTPEDVANAAVEGEACAAHTHQDILRVIAAKTMCGHRSAAGAMLDRWFGKPGPRKRYSKAFEYLRAHPA